LVRTHCGLGYHPSSLRRCLNRAVLLAVGGEAAGQLRMHILQHRNSLI